MVDFFFFFYGNAAGSIYLPVLRIIPDVLPSGVAANYAADTRPAAFIGDYSVVGDNNEVTVDNRSIVNEATTTIYNPVTADTTTYGNWSYDYSTRTYTMMDSNDNSVSTVTYGDEYITINEGGNTYNVYYGTVNMDGSSGGGEAGDDSSGSGLFGKIGDLIGSLFGGVIDTFERIYSKVLDALTRSPLIVRAESAEAPIGDSSVEGINAVGRFFSAALEVFQTPLALYGFSFSIWQVFCFSAVVGVAAWVLHELFIG